MNRNNRYLTAVFGIGLFFVASLATAVIFRSIIWKPWEPSDLPAFIFWTVPPTALLFPFFLLTYRASALWRSQILIVVLAGIGLLAGWLWTLVVYAFLGGFIMNFSMPVFYCWTVGFLVSLLGTAAVWRKGTWSVGLGTAAVLALLVFVILRWLSITPPNMIVYFRPGVTHHDIDQVWNTVLSKSHPSSRGYQPLDGIASLARVHCPDTVNICIRVGFQPRTSQARRDEIRSIALRSPLVSGMVEDTALPGMTSRPK